MEQSLLAQPTPALSNTLERCKKDVSSFLNLPQRIKCQMLLSLYGLASARHHRALKERPFDGVTNWSAEGLKRLYLSCREGLPFHNNYPVVLCDDPQVSTMVERAARLIVAALALHHDLLEGNLVTEREGGMLMEMGQYHNCFSTHRIPQLVCDRLVSNVDSNHIAVLIQGHVYRISVARGKRTIALEDIKAALDWILLDVRQHKDSQHCFGPCILMALPREHWIRTRDMMLQHAQNRAALSALSEAALVVCLDTYCAPVTTADTLALLRDGNIHNRYYDKTVQLVVFENGKAGLCFEHAAVDGSVALGFAAQLQRRANASYGPSCSKTRATESRLEVNRLTWGIDEMLRSCLSFAQEYVTRMRGERKLLAWSSRLGGCRYFRYRELSPDAAVQLAIQMAINKHFGRNLNILEPVQIRRFAGGRLDFVPMITTESRAFIQAMESGLSTALAIRRLHAAIRAHCDLIAQSKAGYGVMAHLLALSAVEFPDNPVKGMRVQRRRQKLLARLDKGLNLIINHDVMAANGSGFPEITAFGTITVNPNSVGIGYVIKDDAITFDVRADGRYRDRCDGFETTLEESLQAMFCLIESQIIHNGLAR
jgi:carnitine O-acetyltransferase